MIPPGHWALHAVSGPPKKFGDVTLGDFLGSAKISGQKECGKGGKPKEQADDQRQRRPRHRQAHEAGQEAGEGQQASMEVEAGVVPTQINDTEIESEGNQRDPIDPANAMAHMGWTLLDMTKHTSMWLSRVTRRCPNNCIQRLSGLDFTTEIASRCCVNWSPNLRKNCGSADNVRNVVLTRLQALHHLLFALLCISCGSGIFAEPPESVGVFANGLAGASINTDLLPKSLGLVVGYLVRWVR